RVIRAATTGDGNAGDIEVRVGTLTLNGSAIFTDGGGTPSVTGGSGHAGNITVIATDSISLSVRSRFGPSGLFTNARGGGDAGLILVSAPVLDIGDGGEIASAALPKSTGNAGDIRLEVGKLTISGDADISTSTAGPGRGGNIHIQARQIELTNNQAAIAASS